VSVLEPAVAGSWYPSSRHELASLVDRLIDEAGARVSSPSTGTAAGIIAPHAGYAFSGAVAASAFSALGRRRPSRAILLGPSHHFGFPGAAIPDTAEAQRTPLGELPLDRESLASLRGAEGFRADDRIFEPEHALEAEVPFLQRLFGPDLPLVPVILGGAASPADVDRVAAALAPLVDGETIVIVSSDFTHYGPRFSYVPFVDNVPEQLRALDVSAISEIARGDAAGFTSVVAKTGATICGRRAIDVLLRLPVGRGGGSLLEYDTSGRMTGSWDHSVSYASMAFP
jgi:AmmeMemoRadiSam system protein B